DDGIFIVPTSGVYVFVWTIVIDIKRYRWASVELFVNGAVLELTFADSSNEALDEAGGLTIVDVTAGGHVHIMIHENSNGIGSSNGRGRISFEDYLS
ncbi:hypothetical protein MHBO_004687, partial [Bonamia ostreae]